MAPTWIINKFLTFIKTALQHNSDLPHKQVMKLLLKWLSYICIRNASSKTVSLSTCYFGKYGTCGIYPHMTLCSLFHRYLWDMTYQTRLEVKDGFSTETTQHISHPATVLAQDCSEHSVLWSAKSIVP